MFLNKIGAEQELSPFWFFMLVLTAAGIYIMIYSYYKYPYDIRELEANVLINKAADCLAYSGKINDGILNETNDKLLESFDKDFFERCNITFNVEKEYDWEKIEQYYLEIHFYDTGLNDLGNITKGNSIIKEDCKELQKTEEYEILPKCANKRFVAISGEKDQILIDIFTGVRKTEKNVRT